MKTIVSSPRLSTYEESEAIVSRLNTSNIHDPHSVLGIHTTGSGQRVIRLWRPGAQQIHIELHGYIIEMHRVHDAGLFEVAVTKKTQSKDYRVYHTSGLFSYDPYVFLPSLSEFDRYLFNSGVHYEVYRKMGARLLHHQGVDGVAFTVWAPSARSVNLVCDVNYWHGTSMPMRCLGDSGIWELFVPGLAEGHLYKFEIVTAVGQRIVKCDPYALEYEMRPKNGCRIVDPARHVWGDGEYLEKRASASLNRPISIYEVHLGSWKKNGQYWKNYRELGDELAEYCTKLGFTHVELMPVCEHPLDESWGYQVSGYFAPTSRYGSFEDFQYFVDVMHQHDIGVILDWVPGHFPTDDFALARFDGTALYEHEDRKQGWHPHWNTYIFNYGRKEVSNFLIASALFWLDFFHIDGLRVDAVASMLYLDYGREEGQWIPNCYGGKENLEAIEFFRHANSVIHGRYPGVLMIAEESTSFAGVSHPVESSGLGFDMKWNMGWMNDSLRYFQRDPIFRSHHQNELTFNLLYAFSEKFISVLSHDEVVHGKRNLLSKMPGDYWQKFANLRLLISYMMCQPGKKLLFMGAEVGQWDEWNCKGNVDWDLLQFPQHQGLQNCVQDMNHFYRTQEALYADDFSYHGFEWVDFNDKQNCIISYLRKVPGSHKALYCVHNFTPTYFGNYDVPLCHVRHLKEVFNTDDVQYGGSGKTGLSWNCHRNEHGQYCGATIVIPPLATTIYEVTWA